jgi:hypothetical protein
MMLSPIFRDSEKNVVSWKQSGKDFCYTGDYVLTKHVLFNLLKNAFYAIKEAGKGNITI